MAMRGGDNFGFNKRMVPLTTNTTVQAGGNNIDNGEAKTSGLEVSEEDFRMN